MHHPAIPGSSRGPWRPEAVIDAIEDITASLVAEAFALRADSFDAWTTQVAGHIGELLGPDDHRVGVRVFAPSRFGFSHGWATDDLARRCGHHRVLESVQLLDPDHPDVIECPPLMLVGEVRVAAPGRFLRVVAPAPGPRSTWTLAIQVEASRALSEIAHAAPRVLEVAAPHMARAYVVRFGRAWDRREQLLADLTPRERSVVPYLVDGRTEAEVADLLGRSPHTVHEYVKRIYKAWGVNSRLQLRDRWYDRPIAHTRVITR